MVQYIRDFEVEIYQSRYLDHLNNLKDYEVAKKFRIIHNNIRSIDRNLDEFKLLLRTYPENFHVIVLTETFAVSDLDSIKIKGYTCLYNYGTYNKNDGVVVYVRDDLQYNQRVVSVGEIRVLELDMELEGKTVKVTGIYRSPQVCQKKFNEDLLEYINKTRKWDYHVIVGDMNINLLSSGELVDEYKSLFSSFGYTSYINDVTRPSSNSCSKNLHKT